MTNPRRPGPSVTSPTHDLLVDVNERCVRAGPATVALFHAPTSEKISDEDRWSTDQGFAKGVPNSMRISMRFDAFSSA